MVQSLGGYVGSTETVEGEKERGKGRRRKGGRKDEVHLCVCVWGEEQQ